MPFSCAFFATASPNATALFTLPPFGFTFLNSLSSVDREIIVFPSVSSTSWALILLRLLNIQSLGALAVPLNTFLILLCFLNLASRLASDILCHLFTDLAPYMLAGVSYTLAFVRLGPVEIPYLGGCLADQPFIYTAYRYIERLRGLDSYILGNIVIYRMSKTKMHNKLFSLHSRLKTHAYYLKVFFISLRHALDHIIYKRPCKAVQR